MQMRLSHIVLFLTLALALAACCTPNLAQGAELSPAATPVKTPVKTHGIDSAKELEAAKAKARKANKIWAEETAQWQKKLKPAQKEQMALLVTMTANNYDVATTAETMRTAVQSCRAGNPGLPDDLEKNWDVWGNDVSKALKTANSRISTLLDYQTVGKRTDIEKYLLNYRRARSTQDAMVELIPVTSEADCKKLTKTLGKTNEKLVKELADTTYQAELDFKDALERIEPANAKASDKAND